MEFEYSLHWENQKKYRPEITDDLIELCIANSEKLQDRKWKDALNAIARIPLLKYTPARAASNWFLNPAAKADLVTVLNFLDTQIQQLTHAARALRAGVLRSYEQNDLVS